MVKVIYEKMADKTLSFGCMIQPTKLYAERKTMPGILYYIGRSNRGDGGFYGLDIKPKAITMRREFKEGKIIGHPLHIGYVLQWIRKYCWSAVYLDRDICNIRPKDHLSHPIPIDPDESRRPLLEFLVGLLD